MSDDNKDNVLKINPDDLTLGMIEMIEELSGQPIGWMGKEDKPQGKMMVCVAFAIGRESDPNYTMEQARKMRVVNEDDEKESDPSSVGELSSETPSESA